MFFIHSARVVSIPPPAVVPLAKHVKCVRVFRGLQVKEEKK